MAVFAVGLLLASILSYFLVLGQQHLTCKQTGQDHFQCRYCRYYGGSQPVRCYAFNSTFDDIPKGTANMSNYNTMEFVNFEVAAERKPPYQGAVQLQPFSTQHFARVESGSRGTITFGAGEDLRVTDWYGYPAHIYPFGKLISFYMGCTLLSTATTPTSCNVTITARCIDQYTYDYDEAVFSKAVVRYVPQPGDEESKVAMQYVNWSDGGPDAVGNQGGRVCFNYTFSATKPRQPHLKPFLYLDEIITQNYYDLYN